EDEQHDGIDHESNDLAPYPGNATQAEGRLEGVPPLRSIAQLDTLLVVPKNDQRRGRRHDAPFFLRPAARTRTVRTTVATSNTTDPAEAMPSSPRSSPSLQIRVMSTSGAPFGPPLVRRNTYVT